MLPLLVGSEQEKKQILGKFPLLNDKRYLPWDGDLRGIVAALSDRLHSREGDLKVNTTPGPGLRIPFPKIAKKFTQRDKDLFLRNSFTIVKGYFQSALQEISRHHQEVETDFAEVHNFKFISTIYLNGEVSNKCKIWIGGLGSSDSIAYKAGQFNIESDNSFNDMLSVSNNEQSLGFKPSGMWLGGQKYSDNQLLTEEQAAEYLWQRFTDSLR